MVLARIHLGNFLASVDWLALVLGMLLGALYGWYLRGVYNTTRLELKVSQLEVDEWVMVSRSELALLPRWTRMQVVAIENDTVSFYARAVGMTLVAHRNGPKREDLSDAQGRHMKIHRRS